MILEKTLKDKIFNSLTSQQQEFLQQQVKRGKKTVFANILAKDKGIILPDSATSEEIEILLDEWILEDYIDNGYVNPATPCECGRPLRYQYIVKHKSTNETRRFGITHFEEHTNIPPSIVQNIKKGFDSIDYELDELLLKVQEKWDLNEHITNIPAEFKFPKEIQDALDLSLPLLDRQVSRLINLIAKHNDEIHLMSKEINELDRTISKQGYSNEGEQFVFELEELNQYDKENRNTAPSFNYKEMNPYFKNVIFSLLENGISSTRVMCEILIKEYSAPKNRYTTGKPQIYTLVAPFLDSLVEQDGLVLKEITGKEDRVYLLKK